MQSPVGDGGWEIDNGMVATHGRTIASAAWASFMRTASTPSERDSALDRFRMADWGRAGGWGREVQARRPPPSGTAHVQVPQLRKGIRAQRIESWVAILQKNRLGDLRDRPGVLAVEERGLGIARSAGVVA